MRLSFPTLGKGEPDMPQANVTWGLVLRVWWAFMWRAMGAFFLLCGGCFVIAVLAGAFCMKFLGWPVPHVMETVGPFYLTGLALAFPLAGLWAFDLLLKARFSGQRLVLMPREAPAAPEEDLPPLNWSEPAQAARVRPRPVPAMVHIAPGRRRAAT